jgi:hypothetical protein
MRPAAGLLAAVAVLFACGCDRGQEQAKSTTTARTSSTSGIYSQPRSLPLPPTQAGASTGRSGPRDWTVAEAKTRIGRATIVVEHRHVQVSGDTVVCWGVGRALRRGRAHVWRRFGCIAPTFRGPTAGPDAFFVLVPTGRRHFTILHARFSSYS